MSKIGKGVLENLTQAMYDDSRIVYREYLQNSCDQIDVAKEKNSFPYEKLEVIITIDENHNIYNIAEEFFSRPLSPTELQKISDLCTDFGDNKVIDAFRTAEAYRKRSLAYVETVLNNEKKF